MDLSIVDGYLFLKKRFSFVCVFLDIKPKINTL